MIQNYRFEIKIPIPLNRLEYMLSWLRLSPLVFRQEPHRYQGSLGELINQITLTGYQGVILIPERNPT